MPTESNRQPRHSQRLIGNILGETNGVRRNIGGLADQPIRVEFGKSNRSFSHSLQARFLEKRPRRLSWRVPKHRAR